MIGRVRGVHVGGRSPGTREDRTRLGPRRRAARPRRRRRLEAPERLARRAPACGRGRFGRRRRRRHRDGHRAGPAREPPLLALDLRRRTRRHGRRASHLRRRGLRLRRRSLGPPVRLAGCAGVCSAQPAGFVHSGSRRSGPSPWVNDPFFPNSPREVQKRPGENPVRRILLVGLWWVWHSTNPRVALGLVGFSHALSGFN